MLNFKKYQWGTGFVAAGVVMQFILMMVWLSPSARTGYLSILTTFGLISLSLMVLGLIELLGFDTKSIREAFAKEKLSADFTRHLYCAANLRDGVTGPFLADRILNEIKHNPTGYQSFIRGLQPGARQILAQYCAREDERLTQQMREVMANANNEVNKAFAESARINSQREDWQHLHRLMGQDQVGITA